MADFVKKTWSCGDVITADELNRMEDGIEEALECCGGGTSEPLIVNATADMQEWEVLGYTLQEEPSVIYEVLANGERVFINYDYDRYTAEIVGYSMMSSCSGTTYYFIAPRVGDNVPTLIRFVNDRWDS